MAGTVVADKWQNGDGTENYKCRAWVNFNGTGTVVIRASGNVSSITDNGTGIYTVNFTTAMPDANYTAPATNGYDDGNTNTSVRNLMISQKTINSLKVFSAYANAGANNLADYESNDIAVFR